MAIQNDTNFTVGSFTYSYNETNLREQLAAKNLSSDKINQVLGEIRTGNLSTLRELGLANLVTISLPSLDEPGGVNFDKLSGLFGDIQAFDMLDAMMALFEAGKEFRAAAREGRLNEMETAMTNAFAAADKIRSAAMFSLVFGCVSGAINVGMGVFGTIASSMQLSGLKASCADYKAAKTEMKQVKSDLKLTEAQFKLKNAKDQPQNKVNALETRQKLEGEVDTAKTKADSLSKEKTGDKFDEAEWKKAVDDYDAKNNELKGLNDKGILGERKTPVTKAEINEAKAKVNEPDGKVKILEQDVKNLAIDAKKNNLAQDAQLEKEVKSLKTEKAKQEKAGDTKGAEETQKKIDALESKRTDLKDARDNIYDDPTSDKALGNASERQKRLSEDYDPATKTTYRFKYAQDDFQRVNAMVQAKAARIQALTSAGGGVAGIIQSTGNFLSEGQRADGAEDTAEQQKASARMDEWAEFQKGMGDLIQSAMDTLKQYNQSMNQANSSIYRNM